jgi:hypothetical protein
VFLFSIAISSLSQLSSARIIGGALMIAAELVQPVNTTLYIVAFILEAAGLSPLLMATLAFLRTVYVESR